MNFHPKIPGEPELTRLMNAECIRCGSAVYETIADALEDTDHLPPEYAAADTPSLCGYCRHVREKEVEPDR